MYKSSRCDTTNRRQPGYATLLNTAPQVADAGAALAPPQQTERRSSSLLLTDLESRGGPRLSPTVSLNLVSERDTD
jgi:hypothetical protein